MQNVQKLKIIFKKFKINNSGRNAFKLVSLNSGQYVTSKYETHLGECFKFSQKIE